MAARLVFFLVGVAFGPAIAQAQTSPPDTGAVAPDTVYALPNVTVEAARTQLRTEAAGARITRLGAADIAATGAHTVADLLEARTGLFVKQYGSGGLASVSLRGTNSSQTLVLVDGQRVADPQTGQVDLSLLPTVLLESVDVLHGASSARYGSGSIGGVVRLHTLQPAHDLRVKTMVEAGAFGERRGGIVLSGGGQHLSGLGAAELSHSKGNFTYTNEALIPRREQHRRNADRSLATLFGKVNYRGSRHRVSVTGWYNRVERGLPGVSTGPPGHARQEDEHARLLLQSTTALEWGQLRIKGQAQRTVTRFRNPEAGVQFSVGDTSQTQRYALNATLDRPLGRHWGVTGGVAAGIDRADLQGGVRRTRGGAFVEAAGRYGRVRLFPALRLDAYLPSRADDIVALSPRLGIDVQPLSWEGWHVRGSAGRAFRAPTFNERFFEPGGNPDLRAEDGWSAEVGTALRLHQDPYRASAEVTAYETHISDQIVWQPSFVGPGVQVWRPSNVARIVTRGLEISLHGRLILSDAAQLRGGGTFTHTEAQNRAHPQARSFGKQLRYVPRQQLKTYLGASWKSIRVDVSERLVGRRFFTTDETQALPPYQVFDLRARYERAFGPVRASLGVTLENVLDRDYSIIRSYPMPSRHARIHLSLETAQ